jgi:hypothetical protein
MAKNYASIYNGGDSIALEQKFFIKEESTRGVFAIPTDADFFYTLSGGTISHTVPAESSPHRSGRHNTTVIRDKSSTEWTIPMFFNIDTTLGAASTAEIDPSVRVLWKSLLGREDITGGSPVYDSGFTPSTTFSLYETGDAWSVQSPGAFVEAGNATFPGDGQAQIEFTGSAKTALTVGIGKSTINNNAGSTVTVQTGEGRRFPVGSKVMIVEANGTTRSTDTPNGSPREVLSVTGDVVLLSGATLADADGSGVGLPIYLVYYEPAAPTAINSPVTGLDGEITIAGFSTITGCVRNATINMVNNHELQDFCYGHDGLGGPLFVAGGRLAVEVSLELNLNKVLVSFLNKIQDFAGESINLVLGTATGRRLEVDMPKVIFTIPEISVPDTGTIPVTFSGLGYQTALDVANEITVSFL